MPKWKGSKRKSELPSNWPKIRAKVLRHANYKCEQRLDDGSKCNEHANQCDHIRRGNDHSMRNLQALCEYHHAKKSSAEGAAALAAKRESIHKRFQRGDVQAIASRRAG